MNDLPALPIDPLPPIDLRHVLLLSDDTGIAQHATFGTPDLHHGYCTDDNARALIAATMARELTEPAPENGQAAQGEHADPLFIVSQRYLAFLNYAFNRANGRFRNFMSYDRRWLEEVGSNDSHARAIWGLGVGSRVEDGGVLKDISKNLFHEALPALTSFKHIRPLAYGVVGICEYLAGHPENDRVVAMGNELGGRLLAQWKKNASDDWPWWEDELTWGNAKMPHALIELGSHTGNEEMVSTGVRSLEWLLAEQTSGSGHLSIIGNNGWFVRDGERARFDQQPIEAKALVQACLGAARVTKGGEWCEAAVRCFEWFRGHNDLGLPLYNPETGGCHDGLKRDGVNSNQGAESTLAYVLSVLELHRYTAMQRGEAGTP